MKYVIPTFGLIAGNFLYAAFSSGDFHSAIERSFFQSVAILAVALFGLIGGQQ